MYQTSAMARRFGLLGSAKSLKNASVAGRGPGVSAKNPPRKAPARGALAAFASDSDSEDDNREDPMGRAAVNRRLAEAQAAQAALVGKETVAAVREDPNVYEYDEVYESVHADRTSAAAAKEEAREKEKKAPRYIGNLLEQAKMRAVEQDRVYDRKLAKEREEGDKEFGQAEMKFVTSSYKRKLMEQQKWEMAEKLEEEKEKAAEEDMKKKGGGLGGGMAGFYTNLLTKNLAMGGSLDNAKSAFTAGSKRHTVTAALSLDPAAREKAELEAETAKVSEIEIDAEQVSPSEELEPVVKKPRLAGVGVEANIDIEASVVQEESKPEVEKPVVAATVRASSDAIAAARARALARKQQQATA